MVEFIDFLVDGFVKNVVGGSSSNSFQVGMLIFLVVIGLLMLAARIDLEYVLLILSPGIIGAAFAGVLPAATLGIIILFLGIILALVMLAFVK